MRPTTLYQATNKLDGKRYIGITVRSLEMRRRRHFQDARSGSPLPFHRALLKYGTESFEWKPLAVLQSQPEAAETEIRAIAVFKPEYNTHPGGACGPYPPDKNAIRRIAEAHHKSVVCLNTGEFFPSMKSAEKFCGRSICAVVAGREVSANGYSFARSDVPLSKEECAELLAIGAARKKRRQENVIKSRRKAVVCITTNERYKSAADAARLTGLYQTSIGECCRGKIIQTGGHRFVFETDFISGNFDATRQKKKDSKSRRVTCLNDSITYNSLCEAARAYKTLPANIRLVCMGMRRVAGGKYFQYEGTPAVPEKEFSAKAKLTIVEVRQIRALIGTEDHSAIAAKFGVSSGTISDIKRGNSWKGII